MRISDDINNIRLLPLRVEAAVFGTGREVPMANINENYRSLIGTPTGDDLQSKTFTGKNSQEEPGVHLHFILPEEFTHGSQKEEGQDILYPDIPNRWTVTRIAVVEKEGKEQVLLRKNWILESDLLSPSPDSDKQYSAIGYDDVKKPYRFLGQMREYNGVITSPEEHLPHLTAVSTGKPYFCGYYPECKNVLGCYDSLSDLEIREGTKDMERLTYIVCGWVENEDKKDPVVCHGIVSNLKWSGPWGRYDSGIPDGTNMPNVAAGNSLEEAAAVLCSYYLKQPEMEKVLEHLFFGTLPQWQELDGALEGEKKIKQYQFRPVPSTDEPKIQGKEAGCFRVRQELLDEIRMHRERQQEYEEKIKEKRQEIYLLWRKYAISPTFLEEARQGIAARIAQINELDKTRKEECGEEETAVTNLKAMLDQEESLLETAGEQYWKPKDLTFLLEGADQSNLYKQLEEYKTDGRTPERTRDRIISKAVVRISGVTEGEEVQLVGAEFLSGTDQLKEPVLEELVREGMLISEGCIFYTARLLLKKYRKQEDSNLLSHTIVEYEKCLSNKENLCGGEMPSPIGNYVWKPAWNPLILEWSMKYYPDMNTKGGTLNLDNWTLKDTDFEYQGERIGGDFFEALTGRCMLSPHGPDYLAEMFGRYLSDEKYKDISNKISGMKILSQSLEGFHEKLLTRRESLVVAPWMNRTLEPGITALASGAVQGMDLYEDLNQSKRNQRKPMEAFYPVRAGAGEIDRIRIIDSFGRVLKYDLGDMIVSENLREGKEFLAPRFLLRPRIMAPMRIKSRWQMEESGTEGEVSPVYGWLWANLLDSCLHIYHPDGTMAGSVQNVGSMDGSRKYKVSLRNPPGQTRKQKEILENMGTKLRGFTEGLLHACEKEPDTLYEFLKSLDESMWTSTSGQSTAQNEVLAYLGRPLALAGINVKLDMKGEYSMPMFYSERDREEPALRQFHVPLRIGDEVRQTDGTAGFYLHGTGEGFDVFHRCRRNGKRDGKVSYVDEKTTLSLGADKKISPISLTVLFHPAGKISMTTGLLPVKEMKLSDAWTERAMKNIYLTLYYGPFLTPGSQLQIFLPKAMEKEWSYLSFEEPGVKKEEEDIKPPWMGTDQEEEWKQIKEGWLMLRAGKKGKE